MKSKKYSVAILSDQEKSYRKPMADSLERMLSSSNVDLVRFDNATHLLHKPDTPILKKIVARIKRSVKILLNLIFRCSFNTDPNEFGSLLSVLDKADLVIVVAHMPLTLATNHYKGVDIIKEKLSVPIVNYDLCFWATRGDWWMKVRDSKTMGGFTGLGRFDWYLAVSNISEYALCKNIEYPVSVIGGDFRNIHLYPQQEEFRALIDFERESNTEERNIQIQVLKELKIPFTELKGNYELEELYAIYRAHSAYFIAHRESFGLPIIEVQLCGCYVFTPYIDWVPSHYIKDVYTSGAGKLSRNFKVYENEKQKLVTALLSLKKAYNSLDVVNEFEKQHSDFFNGNSHEVMEFLNKARLNKLDNQEKDIHLLFKTSA